jgi:hypothetical protein
MKENKMDKLKIRIGSDVDYERVFAEIYSNDKFVAMINQEKGPNHMVIDFPDSPDRVKMVDLEWFLNALEEAKAKLMDGNRGGAAALTKGN